MFSGQNSMIDSSKIDKKGDYLAITAFEPLENQLNRCYEFQNQIGSLISLN